MKGVFLFCFFFNMKLNQAIKTKRFGEENMNGMCFQDAVFQGSLRHFVLWVSIYFYVSKLYGSYSLGENVL